VAIDGGAIKPEFQLTGGSWGNNYAYGSTVSSDESTYKDTGYADGGLRGCQTTSRDKNGFSIALAPIGLCPFPLRTNAMSLRGLQNEKTFCLGTVGKIRRARFLFAGPALRAG
jgi:hypothetical protein